MQDALVEKQSDKEVANKSIAPLEDEFAEIYSTLAPLQKKYVDGRAQGLAPTTAATAAGIAKTTKTGKEYERNPKIRRCLVLSAKLNMHRNVLGREDVIQGFMDAIPHAATATELTGIWRELGKIIGAYEPEKIVHEHRLEEKTREQLAQMSDSELLRASGGANFIIEDEDVLDAEYEELGNSVIAPKEVDYGQTE